MKAASIKEIKDELQTMTSPALSEVILRLGRFKKENKELLTYLLLYQNNEEKFIAEIKESMHIMFTEVNVKSPYITKKNLRKILRTANRFVKYTNEKTTEVELLMFFVEEFNDLGINISRNTALQKMRSSILSRIQKNISALHEDLQYDYNKRFAGLNEL